jgi:hypothetical protein
VTSNRLGGELARGTRLESGIADRRWRAGVYAGFSDVMREIEML